MSCVQLVSLFIAIHFFHSLTNLAMTENRLFCDIALLVTS